MDLSFSGAGFMGCYYFGVVDCWNKYIPRERVNRVAGASAGSLIAAYYLMDLPLSSCLKQIIELTEDVRSRPLGVFDRSNQIVDVLPRVLDRLFPEDAHKRVSGRLHVVMTRLKDMKKIVVNEFETRKDLIDALNCSCFIPVWSGNRVSTYQGVKHIDGGFSDNLPVFDEHTIRICCFSGDTDISPYDRSRKELLSGTVLNTPLYFTFANFKRGRRALFPPPASYILNLLECGFHDTKTFILDNDLIQCESCWNKSAKKFICSQLSPSISPALSRSSSMRKQQQQDDLQQKSSKETFLGDNLKAKELEQERRQKVFNKLLTSKLKNINQSEAPKQMMDDNNNINSNEFPNSPQPPPTILIEDADSAAAQKTVESPESEEGGKRAKLEAAANKPRANSNKEEQAAKKVFLNRRNTLQALSGKELSVLSDKFTLAPEPLPSCPPSPNLNRHCTECIRMRQEARLDNLEEEIRLEAERFRSYEGPAYKDGLRSKLISPLRWFRQLGVKSSYKFDGAAPQHHREIPAL